MDERVESERERAGEKEIDGVSESERVCIPSPRPTEGAGDPRKRVVAHTMRVLRATMVSMGMTSVTTVSKLFMIVTNLT